MGDQEGDSKGYDPWTGNIQACLFLDGIVHEGQTGWPAE